MFELLSHYSSAQLTLLEWSTVDEIARWYQITIPFGHAKLFGGQVRLVRVQP